MGEQKKIHIAGIDLHCQRKVSDREFEIRRTQRQHAAAKEGILIPRLQCQGIPVACGRVIITARLEKSTTHLAPRHLLPSRTRGAIDRRSKIMQGRFGKTNAQLVESEFHYLVGRIVVQGTGCAEVEDSLVGASLFGQSKREIVVRYIILSVDAQGVAPQRLLIAPVTELAISDAPERGSDEERRGEQ